MSEDAPQANVVAFRGDLVHGHLLAGKFRVFPHICPQRKWSDENGNIHEVGCAIWAWLKAKAER